MQEIKESYWEMDFRYGLHSLEQVQLLNKIAEKGIVVYNYGRVPLLYNPYSESTQIFHYDGMSICHKDGNFLIVASERSKLEKLAKELDRPLEIKSASKRFPQR